MESLNRSVSVTARPRPFTLDPSRTAVIVVDMQNDFASEGGGFARAGRDISSIQRSIAPTSRVLAAARDADMKVIYLKIEFRPDLSDVGPPESKNWHAMHAVGIGESVTAPHQEHVEHGHRPRADAAAVRRRRLEAALQRLLRHRPGYDPARPWDQEPGVHGLHDERVRRVDAQGRHVPRLPLLTAG
jgi:hypothetical protein